MRLAAQRGNLTTNASAAQSLCLIDDDRPWVRPWEGERPPFWAPRLSRELDDLPAISLCRHWNTHGERQFLG
jgi:hypothetical protein